MDSNDPNFQPDSPSVNEQPAQSGATSAQSGQTNQAEPMVPQFQLPQPIQQPQPEYLIMEWKTKSRVSRHRSKEYYSSLAVIVLLVSLILFFAGQVLLILVMLSFLFVSYVLAIVRAEDVVHQITTYGLRYQAQKLFYWEQLGRFWLRNNHGHAEIHIEAPVWGNELVILEPEDEVSEVKIQDIIEVLSMYLIYEEPIPSQIDRWVMWLQEKFPLE